jgi:hypothetical protein
MASLFHLETRWAFEMVNRFELFKADMHRAGKYEQNGGLCIFLFEARSAFIRVTACTLAPSPIRDTHSERPPSRKPSDSACETSDANRRGPLKNLVVE